MGIDINQINVLKLKDGSGYVVDGFQEFENTVDDHHFSEYRYESQWIEEFIPVRDRSMMNLLAGNEDEDCDDSWFIPWHYKTMDDKELFLNDILPLLSEEQKKSIEEIRKDGCTFDWTVWRFDDLKHALTRMTFVIEDYISRMKNRHPHKYIKGGDMYDDERILEKIKKIISKLETFEAACLKAPQKDEKGIEILSKPFNPKESYFIFFKDN